ncbi:CHAD domain-containing protein [Pseudomonas typographi]|uniref:CHAD domain-containing protein n=1 Tax=Pseudomonas typographi TaxID=2715964 RepID=A0ABR7Z0X6_9PSED|nr:CHAD domain-containing protein [Pseudomonas typographi]MBD1599054.1 CHAD domain-containing protein [Pseudomonas typographi]
MSATLDRVIARLFTLETHLMACRERLRAQTDSEALHDLRTSVRRLRSLLRPLREVPGLDRLEQAAKAVGELTTPLRDQEVLAAHLAAHGQARLAKQRLRRANRAFSTVAASTELAALMRLLEATAPLLRTAESNGAITGLGLRIDKHLAKQRRRLARALADPAHDRHRLRLLIKRARYAAEAYPRRQHLPAALAKALKRAQRSLGDWHDRLQWLALAERAKDLAPMVTGWHAALAEACGESDKALAKLAYAMEH